MRWMVAGLIAGLGIWAAVVQADSAGMLEVGKFSAASTGTALPSGWKPLTFKKVPKQTRYEVVQDGGTPVVKAVADASASGLIKESRIDPKEYPIVQWRWKVVNVLQNGDVTTKSGDDYPARLYITFEYDPDRASLFEAAKFKAAKAIFGSNVPFRALNYIWESKAPKGSIIPNPYTDWTMMVVVESGTGELNRWIVEERNIYEDFKTAFNEEPLKISGVAVMTDTDNTQESATAYYGDIVFKKAP
ncbi:hypothetical protein YTPLAS18_10840 [Nitrospira sp.]|nr:hypothetical protein YTPLAS18_10840 [Nitrospira sp.]